MGRMVYLLELSVNTESLEISWATQRNALIPRLTVNTFIQLVKVVLDAYYYT